MPLRTALKLCPHAVFLPVDYEAYIEASSKFKNVLRSSAVAMEDVGIDEAYLDISDHPDNDEIIAEGIKKGIYEKTGLTCSIGIAPNKLLAKIASDMQKPDGLTTLTGDDIELRLWPMSIRKLYGIGPKTEENLKEINIRTIGQLAALPMELLIQRFGPSYGHYLYEAARGIDESPLITHWEPKSFSHETTFQTDVGNWQTIAGVIAELTREVVSVLAEKSFGARTITLKIRFSDFQTVSRSCSAQETFRREDEVRRLAFSCLKRIDLMDRKVRLVGVRAGNLEKI